MSPVIDNDVALVEEDGEETEEQDEGSSTDAEGEMVERWRGGEVERCRAEVT